MEEAITCTQCGAGNPPGQRFCAECGGPLGRSQPAHLSALPPWLQEEDPTPDPAASAAAPLPGDDLPDWLRAITDADPAPDEPRPNQDAELPDWMRVATDEPEPNPDVTTHAEPAALPPWLADLGAEDADAPARRVDASELPVWLREIDLPPSPANQPAADAPPVPYQLPAWLHDAATEMPEPPDSPPGTNRGHTGAAAVETDDPSALPAWIRDEQIPAADRSQDALPSWLQDLSDGSTTADAETTRDAGAAPSDGAGSGLPPWLLEADGATPPTHPETSSRELPSWLADPVPPTPAAMSTSREIAEDEDAPGAASVQNPSRSDLPEWLWSPPPETSTQSRAPSAGTGSPATAAGEPLPSWLHELDQSDTSTSAASGGWLTNTGPEPAPSRAAEELPPWLYEFDHSSTEDPVEANGPRGVDKGVAQPPHRGNIARIYPAYENGHEDGTAEADLPPWLADLAPPLSSHGADVPSWLAAPAEPDERQGKPDDNLGAPDYPGGLDLPQWLREAEPVVTAPAPAASQPVPSWLHPADPDSTVANEPAPEPAAVSEAPPIQRTPERLAATQLLERLVAEPAPEPLRATAPLGRARLILWLQIGAFVILIAAILIALLGPRLPLRSGTPVPSLGGAAVAGRLAALQPGTPVLVAYEWDARRAAEMVPLEEAVLAHLVARQVPLMLMTTDPQGAVLSRRRANILKERRDSFYDQVGLGHVDLGFKPGGTTALARMSTAFSSLFERDWAGRDLRGEQVVLSSMCGGTDCSLDRLGLLVVLADDSDDVRAWVEQVASGHPTVPITFVAPAEVVPQIRPYFTQANMSLVAGLGGAYELQSLTGMGDEGLSRRVDATAVGGAAFALLVLAGMLPALWSGRRARRSGKESIWAR